VTERSFFISIQFFIGKLPKLGNEKCPIIKGKSEVGLMTKHDKQSKVFEELSKVLDKNFTRNQIVMAENLLEWNQDKLKDLIEKEVISHELLKKVVELLEELESEEEYSWILKEFGAQLSEPNPEYHSKPEGLSHKEFIERKTEDE
jgi:hypothetical protein